MRAALSPAFPERGAALQRLRRRARGFPPYGAGGCAIVML